MREVPGPAWPARANRFAGSATLFVLPVGDGRGFSGDIPRWVHGGLEEASLRAGVFDLVTAQYPALLRTPSNDAERVLLSAVAPGGVLLVVHHADVD
ncbi:MAG: hypothetical protein QOG76_6398, partial [Pseudonocardiales bacterium]|nr:hypothetical protein [Pseudonocardiales bacterium]